MNISHSSFFKKIIPSVGGQCAFGCSIDVQTSTQASRFWLFGFCAVINDAIALDDANDDEPTGVAITLLVLLFIDNEFW